MIDNKWKKPIQKPIGVYVWTILVLIKFGILNFIGYYIAIRNLDGDVSLWYVIPSFTLSAFAIGAAVWALSGDNVGRIALLIVVPLNILWVVLLAIIGLGNDEKGDDITAVSALIQAVILSLFIIGMEWYFMTKKVVEYYKQNV